MSEALCILAVFIVIFSGPFFVLVLRLPQFPITAFRYSSSTADVCRQTEWFIACSGPTGSMDFYVITISDMTDSFHK
jgi:hypothetical protein